MYVHPRKLTCPLKIDGWKMIHFLLGWSLFLVTNSFIFRGGICKFIDVHPTSSWIYVTHQELVTFPFMLPKYVRFSLYDLPGKHRKSTIIVGNRIAGFRGKVDEHSHQLVFQVSIFLNDWFGQPTPTPPNVTPLKGLIRPHSNVLGASHYPWRAIYSPPFIS